MLYEIFTKEGLRELSIKEIDRRFLIFMNRIDLLIKTGVLTEVDKNEIFPENLNLGMMYKDTNNY